MNKNIIIKQQIIFENYEFELIENSLRIIGTGYPKFKENYAIDSKELLNRVYTLGENLNNSINKYFKEMQRKESKDKMKYYEKDEATLKANYDKNKFIIYNNISDKKLTNKELIYKIEKLFKKNDERKFYYYKLYEIYKTFYYFLENSSVEFTKELISPQKFYNYVDEYVKETKFGIFKESKQRIGFKNCEIYINLNFKKLIQIIKEQQNILDYSKLSTVINYIPLTLDNFIKTILESSQELCTDISNNILEDIKKFCIDYGMPFWTAREEINNINQNHDKLSYDIINKKNQKPNPIFKLTYEKNNNTIPINNFLFICLVMYLYFDLYKLITNFESLDVSEVDNYKNSLNLLDIDITYYNDYKNVLNNYFENLTLIDNYIINNLNSIYNFPLIIYREKKLYNKKKKNTYTEKIYESLIIGAWDTFYIEYFDAHNINSSTAFCDNCKKNTKGKYHKTNNNKILCDECYNERKRELTKERVKKCRNKKRNNHQID